MLLSISVEMLGKVHFHRLQHKSASGTLKISMDLPQELQAGMLLVRHDHDRAAIQNEASGPQQQSSQRKLATYASILTSGK
jgi:hypothetical protein